MVSMISGHAVLDLCLAGIDAEFVIAAAHLRGTFSVRIDQAERAYSVVPLTPLTEILDMVPGPDQLACAVVALPTNLPASGSYPERRDAVVPLLVA